MINATEQKNPKTGRLDQTTPRQIARLLNAEDFNAARAVKQAGKEIAQVILLAAQTYRNKHKIIFIGAGTSGRLGVLEAAECIPTFGTKPSEIIGLIAGGKQEGAEDNVSKGKKDISKYAKSGNLIIGLAASGKTPYVLGALQYAEQKGAQTVLISCNPQADISHAQVHIYLPTGPEALTGSTRLKAGTATKMALNAITTGAMALCGKTYGNLMVDVRPTNKKLLARAIRLVSELAQTDEQTARRLLTRADKHVKTAIIMHRKNLTKEKANKLLSRHNGFLRRILDE